MRLQDLYLKHLRNGDGATVDITGLDGNETTQGIWIVDEPFFYVDIDSGLEVDAKLQRRKVCVYLETGIHIFLAHVRRMEGKRWRISVVGDISVSHSRQYIRIPRNFPVQIEIKRWPKDYGSRDLFEFSAVTRDISAGGLAIYADKDLVIGTLVEVEFSVEEWQDLGLLEAVIVRMEHEGEEQVYGLQFINVSQMIFNRLVRLLVIERKR